MALAIALALGCGKSNKTASTPLPEGIVGEWEVLCRTDRESTSTCLGKEDMGMFKVFRPGGQVTSGSTQGTSMNGTYTLEGNRLVLEFRGGGMRLTERYRARIENDRLVLWHTMNEFGVVHGRKGAKFEAAAGPTSSGKPVSHQIGGLRYTIAVPAKYRLTRDDNNRQRWSPASGDGLQVRLTLSPRS